MEINSMWKRTVLLCVTLAAAAAVAGAQGGRVASPPGSSATQLGKDGKWIELTYGRPIKRGRDLWGSGPTYAQLLLANGAKVWRAGADVSTRIKTEVPLQIGGKTVPAGEYSLFIDTKSPSDWTLIVSSWGAKTGGDDPRKDALWGSYNYTPDKDVARVPMKVDKLPMAIDQLTWNFADVTPSGGKLVLMWDTVIATAPFTAGR
ncbi:MAG: DUF2911 domain-containing protein [Acidobacteriota bacterium]